ncbi:MAG: D-alanine--D-alanine ligase [Bacteroidetes bacterium]|nr:D-alanine--D-alanine ligase [Bacteroidota bacterium]
MTRQKVAILYGGRSVEHGVSINSARNIFEYLDKNQFEPIPIGLDLNGKWYLTSVVDREISKGDPLQIDADPKQPGFRTKNQLIQPDVVFPVLHGTDGEDGSVQGLLTAFGLPFVGSGVLGSALAMNKIIAKQMLAAAGLPVTPFIAFGGSERHTIKFIDIVSKFGTPFMVKAASLGSSVGVSKVKSESEMNAALEEAFRYDTEVLIEQYIPGREIECAILGNNPVEASMPGEIIISPRYEFYSFDAKYVDPDAVKIQVPASLEAPVAEKIRDASIKAFQALRCQDFARVDLFYSEKGIFINEINTIPGFTNSSMYPMMWKERGIGFSDLITRLIRIAQQRTTEQGMLNRDFQSSLKY